MNAKEAKRLMYMQIVKNEKTGEHGTVTAIDKDRICVLWGCKAGKWHNVNEMQDIKTAYTPAETALIEEERQSR